MKKNDEFEQLKEVFEAIPNSEVLMLNMPIDAFLQEAENLYYWALDDQELLVARGLNIEVLNQLPIATGACRYTEGIWFKERYGKQEAEKEWNVTSPEAYELKNDLVYEFEYAFSGDTALLSRVNEIKTGTGHPDMLQDLTNLSVLGNENLGLLTKTSFDENLLLKAADFSNDLADVLARANGDKGENSAAKLQRDKAYTYLRQQVETIRRVGKFVFRKDKVRIVGYYQHYKNAHN